MVKYRYNRRRNYSNNPTRNMVNMGVGNLLGVGLMGASASAVGGLPAGTAKDLAGTAVGLQGVALLGHNIGYVKKAFPSSKKKSYI